MNILIFALNPNTFPAGSEKFNRELAILLLKNKHNVYEYSLVNSNVSTLKKIQKMTNYSNPNNAWIESKKHAEFINKIILKKQIDIIVDSSVCYLRMNLIKFPKEKIIIQQHFSSTFLKFKQRWIMWKIKRQKNICCYSENDKNNFIKYNKTANYYVLPLSGEKNIANFVKKKLLRNKITFLHNSRLDWKHKKVVFLLKIFKNSVYELNLYGKTNKKMINKISKFGNNIKYNGFYHLSEKNKIFSKYDFFILTSDYTEGFGYVLIDAIFNCTPIILRDTYPAARFLVNNGKNGLLLKKNWSPKKCHAEIKNWISTLTNEKYNMLRKNCCDFFNHNLSYIKWAHGWNEIIKQMSKNKVLS